MYATNGDVKNDLGLDQLPRWRSKKNDDMVTATLLAFMIEECFDKDKKISPKGKVCLLKHMADTCPTWTMRVDLVGKYFFAVFAANFRAAVRG